MKHFRGFGVFLNAVGLNIVENFVDHTECLVIFTCFLGTEVDNRFTLRTGSRARFLSCRRDCEANGGIGSSRILALGRSMTFVRDTGGVVVFATRLASSSSK